MKIKIDLFYYFFSGGVGVGKSVLLKVFYQVFVKYFLYQFGENLDDVYILICVLIGKVVFNVGGCIVYFVFNILVD